MYRSVNYCSAFAWSKLVPVRETVRQLHRSLDCSRNCRTITLAILFLSLSEHHETPKRKTGQTRINHTLKYIFSVRGTVMCYYAAFARCMKCLKKTWKKASTARPVRHAASTAEATPGRVGRGEQVRHVEQQAHGMVDLISSYHTAFTIENLV